MSERIIESLGTITKKERLATVESETNSNNLILENIKPYPGYHGSTIPDSLEPDSLYAVTKLLYNDERIIRGIQAVKKVTDLSFDAAPGVVTIQNETNHFVRFKFLQYGQSGGVVNEFMKAGLEFRRKRKIAAFETIIRVKKFFRLKEGMDGIFYDMEDKNMFYLNIPAYLRWVTFEKITMNIKYNMEDKNFDAAQTSVYTEEGLMDFVRIYDKDSCQGKLIHIQERYLEAISKL
jgi:hypothetical protein